MPEFELFDLGQVAALHRLLALIAGIGRTGLAMGRNRDLPGWLDFAKGRRWPTLVCHNYRYRENTRRMIEHLHRFNPGRFLNAQLNFQVAPVGMDSAPWMRSERKSA